MLAALAVLVGGFLIARPERTPETAHEPTATPPAASLSPVTRAHRTSTRAEAHVGAPESAIAGTAARRFLADYLRLISGRQTTRTLRHAAPELRHDLRRHSPRTTPTQQLRPATVRALDVTPQGAGSVRAIATLKTAGGPPYPLLLYLERRGARWLVTRIGDA